MATRRPTYHPGMSWHRVDPRYLRQREPGTLTLAFVSHGELDLGQLVLHLDRTGQVVRFELAFDAFLGSGERLAEWDDAGGLRISNIDAETGVGPRFRGAATLRRYRRPPPNVVQALLAYVRAHADVLEPAHRATIVAALTTALGNA